MSYQLNLDSLTTTKSLEENFNDAIYYEPEDQNEANYAKLFINIEIKKNPLISRTIRRIIFDTAMQSLYENTSLDIQKAFEKTLKNINSALKELSNENDNWEKYIHISIACLAKKMLILSVCGDAKVYLMRNKDIIDISEEMGKQTSKDHVFQDIASGELKEKDTLILSNTALDEPFEEAMSDWLDSQNIHIVFERLEKELEHYEYNILGFTLSPIKNEPSPEKNTAEQDLLQKAQAIFRSITKPFFSQSKNLLKQFFPDNETDQQPERKEEKNKAPQILSQEEKENLENQEEIKKDIRDVRTYTTNSDLSDITNALEGNTYKKPSLSKKKDNAFVEGLKKFLMWTMKKLFAKKKSYMYSGNRKKQMGNKNIFLLIIVIGICFFVGYSIYSKYKENQAVESVRAEISHIEEEVTRAKTQNLLEEKDQARSAIENALIEIANLKEQKKLENEIENLEKNAKDVLDKINEVVRVIPEKFANLEDKFETVDAHSIVKLDGVVYAISKKAVFQLLGTEIVLDPIVGLGEEEFSTLAVSFPDDRSILIVTNTNRVIEYKNGEFNETVLLGEGEKWKTISQIDTWGKKIYVIDKTSGNIWKYSKQNAGFSFPEDYTPVDTEKDLTQLEDLSIDGDIYYLFEDGDVIRTRSQKIEDFEFVEFPRETDFVTSTKIIKSPILKRLYILDPENNLVTTTGYKGYYAETLIFEGISSIRDIFVEDDVNNKRLYVLTDKEVFFVDL